MNLYKIQFKGSETKHVSAESYGEAEIIFKKWYGRVRYSINMIPDYISFVEKDTLTKKRS